LFFVFPIPFLIYFLTIKNKEYELTGVEALTAWKHLLNQFFLITDADQSNVNKTNAVLEMKKFYISSPFAAYVHFLLKTVLKEFWSKNSSIIGDEDAGIQDIPPHIKIIYEIINEKGKRKDNKRCIFAAENFSLDNFYLNTINFDHAELNFSNMRKAYLSCATFIEADLTEANISEASLVQADLKSAKLIHADLSNAVLVNAKLEKADLMLANLEKTDLHKANLEGANIFMANLKEARLTDANLAGVDLGASNLQGADLSGANLAGASLIRTDLSEAKLNSAILSKAKYSVIEEFKTIFPKGFDPKEFGMIKLEFCD
jgi:uncharacterized protein YjbI with pentapeptide repeats